MTAYKKVKLVILLLGLACCVAAIFSGCQTQDQKSRANLREFETWLDKQEQIERTPLAAPDKITPPKR